ncbi:MAG: hypothetical protein JSW69_07915 [Deltaproteobacteria bacterium]|nr:MAG: hypothetical protein JSW69_07915 [Deltaproteobacteria bacterium]
MKYFNLSCFFLILIFLNCSCTRDEASLSLFLGPQEGYKTTLRDPDDGSMVEMIGISSGTNSLKIKNYTKIPDYVPRPPGEPKFIENNYILQVIGDKLLQISNWGETILLKKPLTPNKSKWKIQGKNSSEGDIIYNCKISGRETRNIADQERLVIITECTYRGKDFIDTWQNVYAERLGLVEFSIRYQSLNGEYQAVGKLYFESLDKVNNK